MSDSIRLGFVGAGHRARRHIEEAYEIRSREYLLSDNYLNYPETEYKKYAETVPEWATDVSDMNPEVTALFDPDNEQLEMTTSLCEDNGDEPRVFESLETLLEFDGYDAVLICSPSHKHVDAAIPLIERDVDALCEKPLSNTLEGHDRIIEAAERSTNLFYPAYNLRSSPFFIRIKELLDQDAIGDLGMLSCHEVRGPFKDSYHYSQEQSGGALLDKNCHDFDLFNWYAESDPVRVSAFGGQHLLNQNTDIIDQATVTIEYENGVVGTLELCLYAPWSQRTRKYELRGTDGIVRSPEEETTIDRYSKDGHHRDSIETVGSHLGGDFVQMKRFLEGVEEDKAPPETLVEAKAAAAVAIAAEKAIREQRIVEINDDYSLR